MDDMHRHYNYCLLRYLDNIAMVPEERDAFIGEIVTHYDYCLQFGTELLSTDIKPSDGYCLLLSHVLLEEKFDDELLLLLIATFERALVKSPSNHTMKLFLVNLYNLAGAASASNRLYESLEIKHIMQDTMGYLLTTPCLTATHYNLASQLFGNALRFYTVNYKDVSCVHS